MKGQALGLLVIFNCILSLATAFRSQSVWATGKLLCGTKPASSVYVKLVDKDRGWLFHATMDIMKNSFSFPI